jgi:RNA polymerase sigma-70 factor (ECF subfamily)
MHGLYDLMAARVFGLARMIVRNGADAEEVAQEVWAQVWRTAGEYDPRLGTVASWVLRMTRSRAIDRVRSRGRAAEREAVVGAVAYSQQESSNGRELAESMEAVRGLMGCLPPEQREAVELAFLRGMSREEIAMVQKVPVGTVKTRVLLGLRRLREHAAGLERSDP